MDSGGPIPVAAERAFANNDDEERGQVPGLDDITPEWLTETFQRSGILTAGAVVGCRIEQLGDVPSFTGSFRRLFLTYDRRPSTAPRTLVAKASNPDRGLRATVHALGFYDREAFFYRALAAATPVPVPECYFDNVDQEGRSLFLLEDLTRGRSCRSSHNMSEADAELATVMIARLHAHWWQSPDLPTHPLLNGESVMPSESTTDRFLQCWPAFLAKLSIPITAEVLGLGETIAARLEPTLRSLFHTEPITLIHHDYQGDNLIFDVDGVGTLRVIDWQLAVRARGIVDLAYLLSCSLDPARRRCSEARLLARYVVELAANGVHGYSLAQARLDYRQALLIPPARLALAVASSTALTAHPGAFWDVIFNRMMHAVYENVHDLHPRDRPSSPWARTRL